MKNQMGGLFALWRWLTNPSPQIQRAECRYQSQMLAALLVVVAPVGLLVSLLRFHPTARALIGEPEVALALGMGLAGILYLGSFFIDSMANFAIIAALLATFFYLLVGVRLYKLGRE